MKKAIERNRLNIRMDKAICSVCSTIQAIVALLLWVAFPFSSFSWTPASDCPSIHCTCAEAAPLIPCPLPGDLSCSEHQHPLQMIHSYHHPHYKLNITTINSVMIILTKIIIYIFLKQGLIQSSFNISC